VVYAWKSSCQHTDASEQPRSRSGGNPPLGMATSASPALAGISALVLLPSYMSSGAVMMTVGGRWWDSASG